MAHPRFDGRAVAFVVRMSDHVRAGGGRLRSRIVRRAVVDDDDLAPGRGALQTGDDVPNREPLVERRNDHGGLGGGAHVSKRKLMMSPSWTTYSLPSSRTSPCSRQTAIEPRPISAS